jgi:ribosomal protein S18 acetylase RimI-like enzyme
MLVLEENGLIVGLVQPKEDEINGLWVHPSSQRTGAGLLLLRSGEEVIRQGGHRAAWLNCSGLNVRALRFYRRHGYVETARTSETHPSGIEVPNVRLQRQIDGVSVTGG